MKQSHIHHQNKKKLEITPNTQRYLAKARLIRIKDKKWSHIILLSQTILNCFYQPLYLIICNFGLILLNKILFDIIDMYKDKIKFSMSFYKGSPQNFICLLGGMYTPQEEMHNINFTYLFKRGSSKDFYTYMRKFLSNKAEESAWVPRQSYDSTDGKIQAYPQTTTFLTVSVLQHGDT